MIENNKIILVTNIPTPYRIPLFNLLNTKLKENNYSLKIIFGTSDDGYRKWNIDTKEFEFEYQFLLKKKSSIKMLFYPGLTKLLLKEKAVKIISNGFSIATLKTFILSLFHPIKYIIWSGIIKSKYRKKGPLENIYRKLLCSRASCAIAYGTLAKLNLIELGMPEDKIYIAINTMDIDLIISEVNKCRKDGVQNDGRKHILYLGYLIKGKGIIKLLKIMKKLSELRKDFILDIIGDGPEKKIIVDFIKEKEMNGYVKLHGYKQQVDLPKYLAGSTIFVFPSDIDIWGLVLVEAMAAGLTCFASINAGATTDLISDGETGLRIDFDDTEGVVKRINWALDNSELSEKIGKNASNYVISKANLSASVRGFIEGILD